MGENDLYKVYIPTNGIQSTVINKERFAKFSGNYFALVALSQVCLGCANNKGILGRLFPSCPHCTALEIEGSRDEVYAHLPTVHHVDRKGKNKFEKNARCGMKIYFYEKPKD
jgi:hypothetical protein